MFDVITHTSRRINGLAPAFELNRYLEIGVETGRTFFGVKSPLKVAVDPRFLFDTGEHLAEGVEFHSCTSDAYFQSYDGPTFDLIYVDGLHLFEQVFRDVTNALAHTHAGGIVMVDDIFPSDVFSSFRSWDDAMALRRRLGDPSGDWHGDVYKLLFLIHDFYPSLSYAIVDDGASNKQLALWKRQRKSFDLILNDVALVYQATFYDLIKYEDRFRTVSEQEFAALIESEKLPRRPISQ